MQVKRENIQGYNADVDTAAEEHLITEGGTYPFPAAAAATTIESASANDAAAGTGARTCKVSGLDANFNEISETVTMNGTTPVSLTREYYRINSVVVLTVGSGLVNAGKISVKQSSDVVSAIAAGEGRSRYAIYTCSRNRQNWALINIYTAVLNVGTGQADFKLFTRKNGGSWQLRWQSNAGAIIGSPIDLEIGEDVALKYQARADNTIVSGGFDIIGSSAPL